MNKKDLYFNILYMPLIGEKITIINSKNSNDIGVNGIIINETAKFIILDVEGLKKSFYKSNIIFQIQKKQQALNIDGSFLFSTLQTRLKKVK